MKRPLLLMCTAAVLSACQTPPRAPGADAASTPAPVPEAASQPAAPDIAPLAASPPASPEARQQAQKAALAAADLLQSGTEDGARAELRRALALDAQNKLALSLVRQMTVDPVITLGRESVAYTVRPGDTLALLAQRQLGDTYLFYLLARYNDIRVPKQLAAGQVIRLPGKVAALREPGPQPSTLPATPSPRSTPPGALPVAPSPSPPPIAALPTPTPLPATPGEQAMSEGAAAERTGDLSRALAAYRRADAAARPGATAKVDQMRSLLVSRHTLAARNAFTKQDLDGAIASWQRVLDLDPNNTTARSEQERARGLKVKLGGVK